MSNPMRPQRTEACDGHHFVAIVLFRCFFCQCRALQTGNWDRDADALNSVAQASTDLVECCLTEVRPRVGVHERSKWALSLTTGKCRLAVSFRCRAGLTALADVGSHARYVAARTV